LVFIQNINSNNPSWVHTPMAHCIVIVFCLKYSPNHQVID
jgi:hypothetical protein